MQEHSYPLFPNKEKLKSLVCLNLKQESFQVALISYDPSLVKELDKKKYKQRTVKSLIGTASVVNESYVLLSGFGIGGPSAVMALEAAYSMGVRNFISVGLCAALNAESKIGDLLVIEKALRDEGTSYHYLKASRYVSSTKGFTNKVCQNLKADSIHFKKASSWTTDALFRETKEEIETYSREGVSCVEMEAASIFAFSEFRNAHVCSIAVVSDYFEDGKWTTGIKEAKEKLKKIYGHLNNSLLEKKLG